MIMAVEKGAEELDLARDRFRSYVDFEREVNNLSVSDILVPQNGGDRLPRGHERFSFAPIGVTVSFDDQSTMHKPDGLELPEDYFQEGDNAIALVYTQADGRRYVCAMASAGIDHCGRVLIVENRGFVPDKRGPLYSGIDWRRSLIEAWKAVIPGLGFDELGVRSSLNTPWALEVGRRILLGRGLTQKELNEERRQDNMAYLKKLMGTGAAALRPAYDGVAESMGFQQGATPKSAHPNWYTRIQAQE